MTAGYSGTPLPKKLGIKEGHTVAFIGAPADFESTLGELPADVTVKKQLRGPLDVIVYFSDRKREYVARLPKLKAALRINGGLWIAWPKKASGIATDLSESSVQAVGLATGLVDNKGCAIDETWSGLRFVYRLKDR